MKFWPTALFGGCFALGTLIFGVTQIRAADPPPCIYVGACGDATGVCHQQPGTGKWVHCKKVLDGTSCTANGSKGYASSTQCGKLTTGIDSTHCETDWMFDASNNFVPCGGNAYASGACTG